MPSEKSMRASLRKAGYNRAVISAARTAVTAARRAIAAGDTEEARTAQSNAASALDQAAKRGVVHRNNAARRKSRLARKLQALG